MGIENDSSIENVFHDKNQLYIPRILLKHLIIFIRALIKPNYIRECTK
jgi:hypothetical protein